MERRNAKPKRELVLPGDVIDESGAKAGEYAYSREGKVYAAVMGIKMSPPSASASSRCGANTCPAQEIL